MRVYNSKEKDIIQGIIHTKKDCVKGEIALLRFYAAIGLADPVKIKVAEDSMIATLNRGYVVISWKNLIFDKWKLYVKLWNFHKQKIKYNV